MKQQSVTINEDGTIRITSPGEEAFYDSLPQIKTFYKPLRNPDGTRNYPPSDLLTEVRADRVLDIAGADITADVIRDMLRQAKTDEGSQTEPE